MTWPLDNETLWAESSARLERDGYAVDALLERAAENTRAWGTAPGALRATFDRIHRDETP